jgi:hypothetical protein
MTIPAGYNRKMAWVYFAKDVEVRLLGEEEIDFTTLSGDISRTYTSSVVKSRVGPEKNAVEGHTRTFSFLLDEFPENPVSKTTRLVYEELLYEITGYSVSSDGTRVDVYTVRS